MYLFKTYLHVHKVYVEVFCGWYNPRCQVVSSTTYNVRLDVRSTVKLAPIRTIEQRPCLAPENCRPYDAHTMGSSCTMPMLCMALVWGIIHIQILYLVFSGHFHTFYALFFPLEYIPTLPHLTFVINNSYYNCRHYLFFLMETTTI